MTSAAEVSRAGGLCFSSVPRYPDVRFLPAVFFSLPSGEKTVIIYPDDTYLYKGEDPPVKTIYLAGGCFWGTQHFFDQFSGVLHTETGYANGRTDAPSYEDVRYRNTGHAEMVKICYDETRMSTEQLLRYYFMTIDPLSLNRQGGDVGSQYRTGIYYEDETLLPAIRTVMAEEEAKAGETLAVEVLPLRQFFRAEEYHQDYLGKNPGGYCHIPPRLMHLEEQE